MKITIIIILLSSIFYSCENFERSKRKSIYSETERNFETVSLKNKLVDSLIKFSSLDEFLLRDRDSKFVLYGGEINNTKIGFIAVTDSTLFFYQKFKNKWILNDSIPFDTYAFSYEVIDLNGDNRDDFIINSARDTHGQSIPYVFICNEKNILKYRKDIKLYNMTYDRDKKFIRSFYESCAYCVHSKELYRWVNDSLKLIERVELDLTNENIIKTKYYKEIKGKLINYKTINGDAVYEKALWIE
ncbi:XAC2610-related protein [Flavobacterium sp. P21]|uniref:XAC2610-related protein n=1 Tax=Flavobacterium sp. P21 TaxID=3423948 RepID=UPI003D66683D